jgi:hypothetical protein
MSVIVKGMDMPERCNECGLFFGGLCFAAPPETNALVAETVEEAFKQKKPDWCPLVALPEKHGRLIDGDYLYDRLKALGLKDENVFRIIKEEPTVIESEK